MDVCSSSATDFFRFVFGALESICRALSLSEMGGGAGGANQPPNMGSDAFCGDGLRLAAGRADCGRFDEALCLCWGAGLERAEAGRRRGKDTSQCGDLRSHGEFGEGGESGCAAGEALLPK